MSILINLKNICVNLDNKKILLNINLNLISGKILTIIGPNGAGKSTLVKTILGLIVPHSGKIYKLPNIRIGYVPQKLNIEKNLPITVYKFMSQISKNNIFLLLKKVKADHLLNHSINSLSTGQIRRILLARSFLNNPQILILDEPTQGVDIQGQIMFYNLINEFRKQLNCSVLIISHDLHLVMAKTDEVICLNKNICCSGTPEIVSKNPVFTKMFGIIQKNQLAIYNHDHNDYKNFNLLKEKKIC